MTHSPPTYCWLAHRASAAASAYALAWCVLATCCVLVAGCAGGAWLERPLAAELPVDVPANSYPTAVRIPGTASTKHLDDSAAGDVTPVATQTTSQQNSLAPTTAQRPPSRPPAESAPRQDRPQTLITPLAVVPPELLRSASQPPAQFVESPQAGAVEPPANPSATLSGVPLLANSTADVPSWASNWQPGDTAATLPADSGPHIAPPSASSVAQTAASAPAPVHGPLASLETVRSDLIQALESEIRRRREDNANDDEIPRLEQQLRLVYLTAGRLDDAVSAVESLEPQQQEAYKNLMFGLGVWLSPDEARRPPLRSAKVLHSLRDATSDLAASSKLELKNLVFCERVDYFGWYTEFPKKEFQPKQQVILYVEVENFAAEQKGPAGYETELQGSYEILDGGGQIIASRQLQLDKEICRNYRRDYFLAYRIYMPDSIEPGRYRLELTVEDLKARGNYQGRKLGEGMIEFSIR